MKGTKPIWRFFGKLFFPHYKNQAYINSTLIKFAFWQRICGINRKASWPVHFTSKVIEPQNVENDHGMRAPGYAMGCYIDARNGIIIGEGTIVGPKVSMISKNHSKTNFDVYEKQAPIKIGPRCWLACGCTILAGVELGEHTVVGAGAVVTHSFPEGNQLIAGNPAKVIHSLEPYQNL